MGDLEYIEPTNKQLASFLVVYVQQIPAMAQLNLNAYILERILEQNSEFRTNGLKHHRQFQKKIIEHSKKMEAGELQCEYIRPNGKHCPNFNAPGSYYCGLHKDDEENQLATNHYQRR